MLSGSTVFVIDPIGNFVSAQTAPMEMRLTEDQMELLKHFDKMNELSKGRLLGIAERYFKESSDKNG